MPTCGMFSQATTFDLVLPRILAGEHMDNRTIAELGHGGLLSRDMAYRFPPYRANAARGEPESAPRRRRGDPTTLASGSGGAARASPASCRRPVRQPRASTRPAATAPG